MKGSVNSTKAIQRGNHVVIFSSFVKSGQAGARQMRTLLSSLREAMRLPLGKRLIQLLPLRPKSAEKKYQ
jgi:hypothetical protein